MPIAVTQSIAKATNDFWPNVGYHGIECIGDENGLMIRMSLAYTLSDARAASESAVELLSGYRPHEHWYASVYSPGFRQPITTSHYSPINGHVESAFSDEVADAMCR